MIDIAGPEPVVHPHEELVTRHQALEAAHQNNGRNPSHEIELFNKSLEKLSDILVHLSEGNHSRMKHKWKENKLTHLLQDRLSSPLSSGRIHQELINNNNAHKKNASKTSLIITASPSALHMASTMTTIKFGQRARRVYTYTTSPSSTSMLNHHHNVKFQESAIHSNNNNSSNNNNNNLSSSMGGDRRARVVRLNSMRSIKEGDDEDMSLPIMHSQRSIEMLKEELNIHNNKNDPYDEDYVDDEDNEESVEGESRLTMGGVEDDLAMARDELQGISQMLNTAAEKMDFDLNVARDIMKEQEEQSGIFLRDKEISMEEIEATLNAFKNFPNINHTHSPEIIIPQQQDATRGANDSSSPKTELNGYNHQNDAKYYKALIQERDNLIESLQNEIKALKKENRILQIQQKKQDMELARVKKDFQATLMMNKNNNNKGDSSGGVKGEPSSSSTLTSTKEGDDKVSNIIGGPITSLESYYLDFLSEREQQEIEVESEISSFMSPQTQPDYNNNYNHSNHSSSSSSNNNNNNNKIKVALRMRPMNQLEISRRTSNTFFNSQGNPKFTLHSQDQGDFDFRYDYVFDIDCTQREVYTNFICNNTTLKSTPNTQHTTSNTTSASNTNTTNTHYTNNTTNLARDLVHGINGCILGYGLSGTGKTQTLFGEIPTEQTQTSNYSGAGGCDDVSSKGSSKRSFTMEDDDKRGILPRVVKDLFREIKKSRHTLEFTISCSFVAIIYEKFFDLIEPQLEKKLYVEESSSFGTILLKNASKALCFDAQDVYAILQRGMACHSTISQKLNTNISHSHTVFTLQVSSHNVITGMTKTAQLQVCEMAGFDVTCGLVGTSSTSSSNNSTNKKAKASTTSSSSNATSSTTTAITNKENKLIQKSISALGKVVSAVIEDGKSITSNTPNHTSSSSTTTGEAPYRDSKITTILKDALGGNCKTYVIITASPSSLNISETLNVARLGSHLKKIINRPRINYEVNIQKYKHWLIQCEVKFGELSDFVSLVAQELEKNKENFKDLLNGDIWKSVSAIVEQQQTLVNPCRKAFCLGNVQEIQKYKDCLPWKALSLELMNRIIRGGNTNESHAPLDYLFHHDTTQNNENDENNINNMTYPTSTSSRQIIQRLQSDKTDCESQLLLLRGQNQALRQASKKREQEYISTRNEIREMSLKLSDFDYNFRIQEFKEKELVLYLQHIRKICWRLHFDLTQSYSPDIMSILDSLTGAPDLTGLIDFDSILLEAGIINEKDLDLEKIIYGDNGNKGEGGGGGGGEVGDTIYKEFEDQRRAILAHLNGSSLLGDTSMNGGTSHHHQSNNVMRPSLQHPLQAQAQALSHQSNTIQHPQQKTQTTTPSPRDERKKAMQNSSRTWISWRSTNTYDSAESSNILLNGTNNSTTQLSTTGGQHNTKTKREEELQTDVRNLTSRCIDLQMQLSREKLNVQTLSSRTTGASLIRKRLNQETMDLRKERDRLLQNLNTTLWKIQELHVVNKILDKRIKEGKRQQNYLEDEFQRLQETFRIMISDAYEKESELRRRICKLEEVVDSLTLPTNNTTLSSSSRQRTKNTTTTTTTAIIRETTRRMNIPPRGKVRYEKGSIHHHSSSVNPNNTNSSHHHINNTLINTINNNINNTTTISGSSSFGIKNSSKSCGRPLMTLYTSTSKNQHKVLASKHSSTKRKKSKYCKRSKKTGDSFGGLKKQAYIKEAIRLRALKLPIFGLDVIAE